MGAIHSLISLRGTATPLGALMAVTVYVVVLVALQLAEKLAPAEARYLYPVLGAATVCMFSTCARRLHHAGQSGRWSVVTLIPMAGIIAGFVIALLPQKRAHLNAHNGARAVGYLAILLILIWSLWRVWWTPFWIPSASMKPTLLVGDYVIAWQGGAGDIARGDVVVMRAHGQHVIKRVIGLPGDSVALVAGQVVLNGAPLMQLPNGRLDEVMAPQGPDASRPRCENGVVGDGAICTKSRLREVLPDGRSYQILNIEEGGFADTYAAQTVPEAAIFVLGDNRDNSLDSRYDPAVAGLGFVPMDDVVGRAGRILFSSAGASLWMVWTWRWDRAFLAVQ